MTKNEGKKTEIAVNESIKLLRRFGIVAGAIGAVAYAIAEVTISLSGLAEQAQKVKKSYKQCFDEGKKEQAQKPMRARAE